VLQISPPISPPAHLAVGEDGGVVPLQRALNDLPPHGVEDVVLCVVCIV
jgi:hypothetical protein